MIELRGSRAVLRGFRPDEVDDAMRKIAGGVAGDVDVEKQRAKRVRIERSGSRNEWEVLLAIEVDGRVVGDVQGRCSDQAMPPGVWELGIELYETEDRGRGIGREVVALFTSHLFADEDAHRVQATTDIGNAAMRRVLEVLGFTAEGVLRGFMPNPGGPPRDYEMYAMTRDDWEATRERWTRTS